MISIHISSVVMMRAIVDDVGHMGCQSTPEALISCVGLTLSFHDAHKLSRYSSL